MSNFIAAMDNSGGSAGGVLDLYGQEWTEENKMQRIHEFRLRQINSPLFNSDNIWAGIVYKDSVDRGIVNVLKEKGIETILKIDEGCEPDGTLKDFDLEGMIRYALFNGCYGTKMRSVVKSYSIMIPLVKQQFDLAQKISDAGLMPIVEPEIPIDHLNKVYLEKYMFEYIISCLNKFNGKCILKLTLPETPNLYYDLTKHEKVFKVVGLSGGYSTNEACNRLGLQDDMSASFSRALAEGLNYKMNDDIFNEVIGQNIIKIKEASE